MNILLFGRRFEFTDALVEKYVSNCVQPYHLSLLPFLQWFLSHRSVCVCVCVSEVCPRSNMVSEISPRAIISFYGTPKYGPYFSKKARKPTT